MVFRLRTQDPRRSRSERSLRPGLEDLEIRLAPRATSSPVGYTPPQIRAAYGINQVMFGESPGDGSGQTIAIVCALFGYAALVDSTSSTFSASDLAQFDQEFHLADPASFTILNQFGTDIGGTNSIPGPARTRPAPGRGRKPSMWNGRHAIAPGASIVLSSVIPIARPICSRR